MGYAFQQWFWSFAGEFLVAIIIGVATMIWGIWEGAKRWSAAVNGLVVVAAIVLIINQSGWWEPPVKVKIHQWLDDVSFSIRELPVTDKDGLEFWYEVTFLAGGKDEQKFYVHQSKTYGKNFIVLEAGYDVLRSYPRLKNLSEKELNTLHRQIYKDLMLKGVEIMEDESGINFK